MTDNFMRFDPGAENLKKPNVEAVLCDARNPFKKAWQEYSHGRITRKQLDDLCKSWIVKNTYLYNKPIDYHAKPEILKLQLCDVESNLFWLKQVKSSCKTEIERHGILVTIDQVQKTANVLKEKIEESFRKYSEDKKDKIKV